MCLCVYVYTDLCVSARANVSCVSVCAYMSASVGKGLAVLSFDEGFVDETRQTQR